MVLDKNVAMEGTEWLVVIPARGEFKTSEVWDVCMLPWQARGPGSRRSAFDCVLPEVITLKDQVLGVISKCALAQACGIVPKALPENVDGGDGVHRGAERSLGGVHRARGAAEAARTLCVLQAKPKLKIKEFQEHPDITTRPTEVGGNHLLHIPR